MHLVISFLAEGLVNKMALVFVLYEDSQASFEDERNG